ncbi:MAG: class I SAM-dependent methyltransferase [Coriobacteriia bacterium]
MTSHRFDPAKLGKLNDVARLDDLVPDLMWEAFGAPDARVVVEPGAGTGMFAREFASRMLPGGTLYAADISSDMIMWMGEHLDSGNATEIVTLEADAAALPLEDSSAELLYTVNLHHELDDVPATLAEAFRILAPGGRIAIVDWKKEPTPKGPPMEIRVSAEEIAAHLLAAGFEDPVVHPVLRYHSVLTATRP